MEPLAPHEKIFVDSEIAEDENHGELGCEECHGGNPNEPDWRKAHEGVVKDPTYPDPSETCGACHDDIAEHYNTSLHISLGPFKKIIDMRADKDKTVHAKVTGGQGNPLPGLPRQLRAVPYQQAGRRGRRIVGGSPVQKRPPMHTVCLACHGSRIEKEYFGKNKGIPPDIHKQKYFKCSKCHKAQEMHGDGEEYANRYEVRERSQVRRMPYGHL